MAVTKYRHPHHHNLPHLHHVQHQKNLPFTYVILAALSFTSCLVISWYTFERGLYLPNDAYINMSSDDYMEQLFDGRRKQIEIICRRRYPKQRMSHPQLLMHRGGRPYNQRLPYNLYVSEPLKIIFCSIPKVASSNWFAYFDRLSRNSSFTGWNGTFNASRPVMRSITSFTANEAKYFLEHFRKIMWVREPLQRLVSAWRDKLTVFNPYYSKVVGSEIIRKFRSNASKAEIDDGYPSTLEEFFRYLKSYPRTRYDVHWRPFYFACSPCNQPVMTYDFIGHLETLNQEADYILRQITRRSDYPPFPAAAQNRTSESILRQAVSSVPGDLVDVVMRNFQIDYELFGYERPDI